MKLFVIADLHLSEGDKVDKPMSRFGQRWENHVQRLREAWEAQVSREDTVLIPGDISWATVSYTHLTLPTILLV